MNKSIFFLLFLALGIFSAAAQTSINNPLITSDKYWINSSSWADWNTPLLTIPNGGNSPTKIIIRENDKIVLDSLLTIDKNNFTLEIFGTLIIKDLEAAQNLAIIVHEGGSLIITNNITIDTQLSVTVDDGASFIVGGTLQMHNNAALVINGTLEADTIKGHNNNVITGTGTVTAKSIDGVNTGGFTGIIVNADFPSPTVVDPLFVVSFVGDNYYVTLNWGMNSPARTDLVGFTIYRDGLKITGTNLDLNLRTYIDESGLTSESNPIYAIYAVYADNVYSQPLMVDFSETPLPISLISFDAKKLHSSIRISWDTATEINNMGFEIHRSVGSANSWSAIGFVDGHNNSNSVLSYEFIDIDPADGINYYRLKQIDYDGAIEYFGPVAESFGQNNQEQKIRVVNTQHSTILLLPGNEPGTLELYDMRGRLIFSKMATGKIEFSDIKGTYIVRFNDGIQSAATKITL
jgi:hypothetical protein